MRQRPEEPKYRIWKKVDPSKILDATKDQKTGQGKGGVAVTVHVSPYDVPERIEGFERGANGPFRIQFHYLDDDEPQEVAARKPPITVYQGKYSQRISAIDIDVEASPDWVALVLETLDSLEPPAGARLNRKATHKAFEDFVPEIPPTLLEDISRSRARA